MSRIWRDKPRVSYSDDVGKTWADHPGYTEAELALKTQTSTNAATEYVLRALLYSGGWGLEDNFECATLRGKDIVQFLFDALPNATMKKGSFVLHGVHTHTWWRFFRHAWDKLHDLDELKVRNLMEAEGLWDGSQRPAPEKPFNFSNLHGLYSKEPAINGWRYCDMQQLRKVVDRILGAQ